MTPRQAWTWGASRRGSPSMCPETGADLSAELIAGGKSNLTYVVTAGSAEWIVRRPPLGHVLATAHHMAREYTVMTAAGHARASPGHPRTVP